MGINLAEPESGFGFNSESNIMKNIGKGRKERRKEVWMLLHFNIEKAY